MSPAAPLPLRATAAHDLALVVAPDGGRWVRKALRAARRDDEGARLRLLHEGAWLRRLGGRHHVLACARVDEDPPALLLEHAPLGDLAARLTDGAPLPWPAVRRLAFGLGDALDHLHAHGLVHRDVKPSNVLLAADGAPRLADLGVAAHVGSAGSLGDAWDEPAVGTLGYAAPEQLRDAPRAVHPAADVHAFAALLHELCTGVLPWALAPDEDDDAYRARRASGPPAPDARRWRPALAATAAVLAAGLDPRPARRPPTAGALAAALVVAGDADGLR